MPFKRKKNTFVDLTLLMVKKASEVRGKLLLKILGVLKRTKQDWKRLEMIFQSMRERKSERAAEKTLILPYYLSVHLQYLPSKNEREFAYMHIFAYKCIHFTEHTFFWEYYSQNNNILTQTYFHRAIFPFGFSIRILPYSMKIILISRLFLLKILQL